MIRILFDNFDRDNKKMGRKLIKNIVERKYFACENVLDIVYFAGFNLIMALLKFQMDDEESFRSFHCGLAHFL